MAFALATGAPLGNLGAIDTATHPFHVGARDGKNVQAVTLEPIIVDKYLPSIG
jgi:hypothetical protein